MAGFLRCGAALPNGAALPKGSPKQAAVEAVTKERLLSAEENKGRGGWGFMASGGFGGSVLRLPEGYVHRRFFRSVKSHKTHKTTLDAARPPRGALPSPITLGNLISGPASGLPECARAACVDAAEESVEKRNLRKAR